MHLPKGPILKNKINNINFIIGVFLSEANGKYKTIFKQHKTAIPKYFSGFAFLYLFNSTTMLYSEYHEKQIKNER